MTDILEKVGFKVIEAKDATEALRVLEAKPGIHVLLTNAEVPPGPTGFELALVRAPSSPCRRVLAGVD
jgi:two-component system, response regulator PdtaR